jgi:hypothetical protein
MCVSVIDFASISLTVNGNVIKINVDMYLDLGNSHWKNKNLPQMS